MSMRRPRHNLGRVDWIGVESVGVPGQRTFRLLVATQQVSAHMWLEKEQLQALDEALARLLAEIDAERGVGIVRREETTAIPKPDDFPATPDLEIYIGQLGLRYDTQRELIGLETYERGAEESEPPAVRCLATRKQMESLHESIGEVISSGRPRCPFCGAPLSNQGMPHFCPPTNGHQKVEEV